MRSPFFAALAVLAAIALLSLSPAHAGPATASLCRQTACLLPPTGGAAGKPDRAIPRPMLAKLLLDLTVGCPPGFSRDGEDCVLLLKNRTDRAECPDGMRWNGEDCVRDRKAGKRGGGGCVVGYHWDGEECVPDRQGKKKVRNCPEGTKFANGKCRKSEFPPVEGEEGGGGQDDGFSCSHNDHLENGRCVPCKEGFHVEGDDCVAD